MEKLNKFLDLVEKNDRASGTVLLYKNQTNLYRRNFGLIIQAQIRIYPHQSNSKNIF